MIAIIFAAGIGSRLRPFTDHHPKALAPVAGTPAILRAAEHLRAAGATRIIVNVHHFAQQVVDCLMQQPWADIVEISDESDLLLDTGGALVKMALQSPTLAAAADDETVIIHNADIVTDFDIAEMLASHTRRSADVSILVDPVRFSTRHFLFDSEDILRGWENTATAQTRPDGLDTSALTPAAFGGVHLTTAGYIRTLASQYPLEPFSITNHYITHAPTQRIAAHIPSTPYRWHDIGTPEKLDAANQAFAG